MSETNGVYHDLESKAASLKSAVRLLREGTTEEKRELIKLMHDATKDIQRYLSELEKDLN